MAGTLNKALDDAEDAASHRNRALDSVWMKMPGAGPVLHDRDNKLREHVSNSNSDHRREEMGYTTGYISTTGHG